ncbi:MAG: hypothetical protein AAF702_14710 [Chloroflexota bacterium]
MTTEQALWHRRWESLNETLLALQMQYEHFQNESDALRENTIFQLLFHLQQFGAAQFRFFHDGFFTKQFVELQAIPDEQTFDFPQYITSHSIEQHVLHNILRQIAADMEVIQRASQQRFAVAETPPSAPPAKTESLESAPVAEQFRITLITVDKLALTALRMFHGYLENDNQTALTYFRRSANVRVIPYAPVALIGIPVTVAGIGEGSGVVEDLLAIPHEVGHHVYWNGRVDGRRIHAALEEMTANSLVAHWCEEIFADVVGCLIGGPVVARSFIELELTSIGHEFVHADNPHPMPALRPLLYAYTLEKMKNFPNIAAEIRTIWQAQLNERKLFVNRELLYAGYQLVDDILAVMNKEVPHWLLWSEDVAYADLYENFSGRIENLVQTVPDEGPLDPADLQIQTSWFDLVRELAEDGTLSGLENHWEAMAGGESESGDESIKVDAAAWLRIYDFGGWITAGPQGGNISPD